MKSANMLVSAAMDEQLSCLAEITNMLADFIFAPLREIGSVKPHTSPQNRPTPRDPDHRVLRSHSAQ